MTFPPFLLFLNPLGANQQPQCWPRTVIAIFDFSFPYGVDPDRDVHANYFSFFVGFNNNNSFVLQQL